MSDLSDRLMSSKLPIDCKNIVIEAVEHIEAQAKEIERLKAKIDLLEACREYDASGENRPDGYILANHYVAERQSGKS